MEFPDHLLRRYRADRRKLLEFLLSSGLIREIKAPAAASLSDVDFDFLSADYVLECIQSGGVLDVSQAIERYQDESSYPVMRHLQSRDEFYLHSDPNVVGSPPHRVPPPITNNQEDFLEPHSSQWSSSLAGERSNMPSQDTGVNCQATGATTMNSLHTSFRSIGLPTLETSLSDDDLRETAYEVFLACMLFSGVQIHTPEARKREKSSRFLTGLKNKKEKRRIESESPERLLKVLDTVRIQMQISEVADTLIKRRLAQFVMGKSCGKIDVPQLALALLTGILRSDFPSPKSYLNWKNRQANVLEELLSSNYKKSEKPMIGASLATIRNLQEWDILKTPSERSDALLSLRQAVLSFSSIPGRFGMEGETYYWTAGYHLNIRLYEKLLYGLFDILDDCELIEEADEIMKLLRLTWSVLGITDRVHHALFAWVLFQQFVATQAEEAVLLDYAIREVEKGLSAEVCDDKEVAYIKSLACFATGSECGTKFNVLQSIFLSISSWCDGKLQDYHLYFGQKSTFFERVLAMGLSTGTRDFVPHANIQIVGCCLPDEITANKMRTYVKKSMAAACIRVTGHTTTGPINDKLHPLAILASELRLIAEKDLSVFSPVLRHWYAECAMVSAKALHQFYGEKLMPFLKGIACPTEDDREVLSAAYALERCLTHLYSSACKENNLHHCEEFDHYPIAEISRSMILEWVVAQHDRILEWTGRAFDLEDWEPLSSQKKYAASAVEVFRIIEETVDQFFGWNLPMNITHLQALLSIIFHSLDTYLLKVVSQLVDKQNLYPSTPPLTRFKEASFPIVKKKVVESSLIDDKVYDQLDELTTSKLCIKLNTYRYMQKQITLLEDGIRKSWDTVTSYQLEILSMERAHENMEITNVNQESVSELFGATLDCISDSASNAMKKISEFLGAKIIFWDMRDSFLYYLYYGSVEGNRIEGVLPEFDKVLNNVCGLIDDSIRDLVVSNIWKASLEGFMWVLLDGGPLRAFCDTDIPMIEEDFSMLKDLFVAEGEGLPRSSVEAEAKFYHQILDLFSQKTETLTRMLMASSKRISAGTSNNKYRQRYAGDAHTLIRVLCHKKDKEASKFLKSHYRLPPSSDYGETAEGSSSFSSPYVADLIKKSASFRWSEKGQSSFRSFRKKLQVGWS